MAMYVLSDMAIPISCNIYLQSYFPLTNKIFFQFADRSFICLLCLRGFASFLIYAPIKDRAYYKCVMRRQMSCTSTLASFPFQRWRCTPYIACMEVWWALAWLGRFAYCWSFYSNYSSPIHIQTQLFLNSWCLEAIGKWWDSLPAR